MELGLSDQEWLEMTPRMLHQLCKQYVVKIQRDELMISRLTAFTANFSIAAPKEPFSEDDFMIHPYRTRPKEDAEAEEHPNGMPGDRLLHLLKTLPPGAAIQKETT